METAGSLRGLACHLHFLICSVCFFADYGGLTSAELNLKFLQLFLCIFHVTLLIFPFFNNSFIYNLPFKCSLRHAEPHKMSMQEIVTKPLKSLYRTGSKCNSLLSTCRQKGSRYEVFEPEVQSGEQVQMSNSKLS